MSSNPFDPYGLTPRHTGVIVNIQEPDESKTVHDLLKEDMRRATDQMNAILAQAMFTSTSPYPPIAPPTRRQRWIWRWRRVQDYCSTLWQALCGADLVERNDDFYD